MRLFGAEGRRAMQPTKLTAIRPSHSDSASASPRAAASQVPGHVAVTRTAPLGPLGGNQPNLVEPTPTRQPHHSLEKRSVLVDCWPSRPERGTVANGSEQSRHTGGSAMKLLKLAAIPALALAAGIGLAACGQVTVKSAALSTGKPAAVSGPMIPARGAGGYGSAAANDTVVSTNWSGYAAHTGQYKSISAAWTEPEVRCPATQVQYSSFWVGLDGYKSNSVEQLGTDSACKGMTPVYDTWFEMYPASPVYFTNPVHPGDLFTASVTVRDGAYYTLKIADSNRGWSHTVYATHHGLADSSAEVIAEAPSSASGVVPLADFGNVYFSAAEVNGHSMGSVPHTKIVMQDNSSQFEDYVSSLTDNGQKFQVTWAHSS